jgi:hypothetical protein
MDINRRYGILVSRISRLLQSKMSARKQGAGRKAFVKKENIEQCSYEYVALLSVAWLG